MISLLALSLAATASPALARVEARWLPIFRSAPGEADLLASFGAPDETSVLAGGEKELYYRKTAEFPAGIAAWLDGRGRVADITFFVAPVGRVWTRDAKLRASRLASPIALDDVLARYGKPDRDKKGTGRRVGVRRLIYEEGGTATRSVVFGSVPFSPGLHTVTLGWEWP